MFAHDLDRLATLHGNGQLSDEEFQRAKARVIDGEPAAAAARSGPALNLLRLSRDDRWLGGVCGGLAQISGIESWLWRILFVLLLMFGGCSLAAYVLLWIFVPRA